MDPLSDVLSLLKPRSYVSAGFDAGGAWAVRFAQNIGIKCYAVVSGGCWLAVEGVPYALRLSAGDCFLLPAGRPFRLASELDVEAVSAEQIFTAASRGGVATVNGGGELFLVGSRFALSGNHADVLLAMLPPIVHIQKETDRAALRWLVERMMQELREPEPGGFLVVEHLAHMMLVQALRLHMTEASGARVGWLFALADPRIGVTLKAMHDEPGRRWTLEALANLAAMSRSVFAQEFKEKVGSSPIDYLARWRMLLAGDRLASTTDSVSVIARSLGYESESAFSTAFKRVMGQSPRTYAKV